jgi:hypothetical protein
MSDSIVVQVHSTDSAAITESNAGDSLSESGLTDTLVTAEVIGGEETKTERDLSTFDVGGDHETDELVRQVVASVKTKIVRGRLEEGSSKAIRKAMEKASSFLLKGSQKKEVVLRALALLSAHAPEKWRATLEVAPTQIDELFKLAQGLSALNANSTLADVAGQLEAIAQSKALACCLPCFGNRAKK